VLLKAGHLTEEVLTDIFYNAETDEIIELTSKRVTTVNTHGTGCTFSSALASFLAHDLPLNDAVYHAKNYMSQAIIHGSNYEIGKGHGPVHHFYAFWK
jgi:hydroxymethylpyrimidine/phosphomethylpyrimidine kinase